MPGFKKPPIRSSSLPPSKTTAKPVVQPDQREMEELLAGQGGFSRLVSSGCGEPPIDPTQVLQLQRAIGNRRTRQYIEGRQRRTRLEARLPGLPGPAGIVQRTELDDQANAIVQQMVSSLDDADERIFLMIEVANTEAESGESGLRRWCYDRLGIQNPAERAGGGGATPGTIPAGLQTTAGVSASFGQAQLVVMDHIGRLMQLSREREDVRQLMAELGLTPQSLQAMRSRGQGAFNWYDMTMQIERPRPRPGHQPAPAPVTPSGVSEEERERFVSLVEGSDFDTLQETFGERFTAQTGLPASELRNMGLTDRLAQFYRRYGGENGSFGRLTRSVAGRLGVSSGSREARVIASEILTYGASAAENGAALQVQVRIIVEREQAQQALEEQRAQQRALARQRQAARQQRGRRAPAPTPETAPVETTAPEPTAAPEGEAEITAPGVEPPSAPASQAGTTPTGSVEPEAGPPIAEVEPSTATEAEGTETAETTSEESPESTAAPSEAAPVDPLVARTRQIAADLAAAIRPPISEEDRAQIAEFVQIMEGRISMGSLGTYLGPRNILGENRPGWMTLAAMAVEAEWQPFIGNLPIFDRITSASRHMADFRAAQGVVSGFRGEIDGLDPIERARVLGRLVRINHASPATFRPLIETRPTSLADLNRRITQMRASNPNVNTQITRWEGFFDNHIAVFRRSAPRRESPNP